LFPALFFVGELEDIAEFSTTAAGTDGFDRTGQGPVGGEGKGAFAFVRIGVRGEDGQGDDLA